MLLVDLLANPPGTLAKTLHPEGLVLRAAVASGGFWISSYEWSLEDSPA